MMFSSVHRWLAAREVSLYLLFGFVLSIICLWLFWEVAEDVYEGDPIVMVDVALANELHAQATPSGTAIYKVISVLGGQGSLIVGVVVAVYCVARREWLNLTFWMIALGGGLILNTVMKAIVARPRPVFVDPLAIEQTYSFPSGHSMTALITFGMLGYFLWRAVPNRLARIWITFGLTLFVALVGISRMTLGVHYLSDVLGGFAAGGIWLGACIFGLELLRRRGMRQSDAVAPISPQP